MAVILRKAWEIYTFVFMELPDPRTEQWFLLAKPYQGLAILGLYLIFVLKWGPKYMKGRPAYNLDKLMIVYNILQVITCVYIFYNALVLAWAWDYKWICEPVDYSTTDRAVNIAKFTYYYFLTKVVDLLDTVFFVLRKKYRQITFLHIYHHTGMVILTWAAATYYPGGHGTLIGVINTFVHIVMYSYYLYTVVNPSAKHSIWWKKYITQLQIARLYISFIEICSFIKPTIVWLLNQRFHSGNFPSSMGSGSGDRLVQWCHGAPGFVPLCTPQRPSHITFYNNKEIAVKNLRLDTTLSRFHYFLEINKQLHRDLVQFFWCVVHMLAIVFKPDCAYPRWTSAVFLPQNLFILVLFIDFYIKNYIRKPQVQQSKDLQKKTSTIQSNGSITPSSDIYKNNSNSGELKILKLALNSLNNRHQDVNEILASQNGTESSQNRQHRIQKNSLN